MDKTKKYNIIIIATIFAIIVLVISGIVIHKNTYTIQANYEDISYEYTIFEETIGIQIRAKRNIKNLKYTLLYESDEKEEYSREYSVKKLKAGETITKVIDCESITKKLNDKKIESINFILQEGKIQTKNKVRSEPSQKKDCSFEITIEPIKTYDKIKNEKKVLCTITNKTEKNIIAIQNIVIDARFEDSAKCTLWLKNTTFSEPLKPNESTTITYDNPSAIYANFFDETKTMKTKSFNSISYSLVYENYPEYLETQTTASSNRRPYKMDETTITAIIVILIGIGSMIAVASAAIKSNKEARKEREWKESTRCIICGAHSWGHYHCKDCWNRIPIIKKELPYSKIKDFETINEFKQELTDNVIFAESKYDQEFNAMRLMAVCEILKEKYFVSDAVETARDFLKEISEYDYTEKEIIINKYASAKKKLERQSEPEPKEKAYEEEVSEPAEPQSQFAKTDFRQRYKKPYRCNDGDYVRSKSEREIDDFLFAHKIWHIYEPEYICHNGKKYYPDFLLSDYNLYIEYFGKTDEEYIAKKEQKIADLSAEPNIFFEYLEHTDDANITEKLTEICKKYNILK